MEEDHAVNISSDDSVPPHPKKIRMTKQGAIVKPAAPHQRGKGQVGMRKGIFIYSLLIDDGGF
jgi:hypothetical protein